MADSLFDFMTIAKALTDENRVRILMALDKRELCVCQVTGFLDLSPSTTSKHLSILRQARLIESRKKGKWVYYSVPEGAMASPMVATALAWVKESLKNSAAITVDEERIACIIERESEYICSAEATSDTYHSLEIHSLAIDDEGDA